MKKLIYILAIFSTQLCFGQNSEDCVFSTDRITGKFIDNIENVATYKWDNKNKDGESILTNGDSLFVKFSACFHYNINIQLKSENEIDIAQALTNLLDILPNSYNKAELLSKLEKQSVLEDYSDNHYLNIDARKNLLSITYSMN